MRPAYMTRIKIMTRLKTPPTKEETRVRPRILKLGIGYWKRSMKSRDFLTVLDDAI